MIPQLPRIRTRLGFSVYLVFRLSLLTFSPRSKDEPALQGVGSEQRAYLVFRVWVAQESYDEQRNDALCRVCDSEVSPGT